jgi:dATP pyrophosphohydrolase
MRLPIQILVYPARRQNGAWQFLLLRRIPRLDGRWQGVTGGVEEGEEVVDTARRELTEETGLEPLKLMRLDYTYTFPVAAKWQHLYAPGTQTILEHTFVAVVAPESEPALSFEHDAMKWCGLDEALDLLYWPNTREALKRAAALLADDTTFPSNVL